MKIAIGSDHGGFEARKYIVGNLHKSGYDVIDVGCVEPATCDYVDYAVKVCELLQNGDADFGILICGTGIGMSIVANKFCGIRAALCVSTDFAKLARNHNDANVLCTSGRFVSKETALEIVDVFLSESFDGDRADGIRHKKRVDKIALIDERERKCRTV
jgi:ribose 5-phosphate isomerase B